MQSPSLCPHRTGCDGQGVCSSVSVGTLASPWCVWGSGGICVSLPMCRAPAGREECWSQKSQLPENVWDGYVIRPIAHPIQLNQNQQESLSQYISSFKIFVTSLCPSHLCRSMQHTEDRCRRHQGRGSSPTLCQMITTDFNVCSLQLIFRCNGVVVGSAEAPLFPLMGTHCHQDQPHQAARDLTSGRLTTVAEHNWDSLSPTQKTIAFKRSSHMSRLTPHSSPGEDRGV